MDRETVTKAIGQSPLTDLRSLGTSTAFHALLLIAASVLAIRATLPSGPPPNVLHAEIGPVDNRAPAEAGGGAPGDVGGTGVAEALRISADQAAAKGKVDPTASPLIGDAVPAPLADTSANAPPSGPSTSGIGLLPGEGLGGGGGSGGGSGGGIGRGTGPGTEFFGARERADSFAYVIDCSGSMTNRGALKLAKQELLASLDQLPPDARFAVVFYNINATVFADSRGEQGLMAATVENKSRVRTRLSEIAADGGTDHQRAMLAAIALKPEVIFFLTDAERMDAEEVAKIREAGGSIRIQAIEFGDGPELPGADRLKKLALSTGGGFRHIDLSAMGPGKK